MSEVDVSRLNLFQSPSFDINAIVPHCTGVKIEHGGTENARPGRR